MGSSQAAPSGPSLSSSPRWETLSGTSTPVRSISRRATRRKWCAASSSLKATSTAGRAPWSSVGREEVWLDQGGEVEGNAYFAFELFLREEWRFQPDATGIMTIVDGD